MDQSSFGILAHNYLRVQNIALVHHANVKEHDASERSKMHMNFLKNAHKFQKISYSGIISFSYVGKECDMKSL